MEFLCTLMQEVLGAVAEAAGSEATASPTVPRRSAFRAVAWLLAEGVKTAEKTTQPSDLLGGGGGAAGGGRRGARPQRLPRRAQRPWRRRLPGRQGRMVTGVDMPSGARLRLTGTQRRQLPADRRQPGRQVDVQAALH